MGVLPIWMSSLENKPKETKDLQSENCSTLMKEIEEKNR